MQTFLPYPNFFQSVACLDDKRLGKQRVECLQILKALETGKGWIHHPITKMWKGYEHALGIYMNICILEWEGRGFNNTMKLYGNHGLTEATPMPFWLEDVDFHSSHRSNLLRKDPDYYGQFGWDDDPDNGYVWFVDGVKYRQVAGTRIKEIIENLKNKP